VPYVPPVSPASGEYLTTSGGGVPVLRYPLQVMGKQILVETPLVGRHQLRNVALAVATAEELSKQGFRITPESIERGIREMPYDPDIWVHYGQFIAFLAPSWLTTEAERDQWRQDGAAALVHATDLGADIQQTLAATTMLSSRFGEKDAAIRALSREYALTDSESIRAEISAKLEKLQASRQRDQAETVIQTIEGEWRRELPFLRRDTFMLLGPLTDTAACAGPASEGRRECAPSWDDAVVAPSLL